MTTGPSNPAEVADPPPPPPTSTLATERRGRHFLRAGVVGVLAGAVGILYAVALFRAEGLREQLLAWLHDHAPIAGVLVLPVIGAAIGCFIGYTTRRFAPEAAGSGIPHVKAVLVHVRTMGWKVLLPLKFINGVLGAGIGLSLGREGPTVQMGAACGRAIAGALKLKRRQVPGLVSLGAGAGLAAAFNAPLAGFIFVLEELQREMSPLTYGGALVAAVCASVVTRFFTGQVPSFQITGYAALPLTALPLVAVLGVATGYAGVLFNRSLIGGLKRAQGLRRLPAWMLPGIAGAVVGFAAWWLPDAVGGGHSVAERALGGNFAGTLFSGSGLGWLLLGLGVLLLAKFWLTVVSYISGAPGGIFAPMLLMGALLGLIVGKSIEAAIPSLQGTSAAFAVLGMAGFFASSVRAPLTGIVLILEMTANYEQLFALSVVCLVAYLVAERLKDPPIYEALLEYDLAQTGAGPAHDEPVHVVVSIHRGSAMDGKALREVGLPSGALVVAVERGGRELVPGASLQLRAGDHVTVLVPGEAVGAALRVVELAKSVP